MGKRLVVCSDGTWNEPDPARNRSGGGPTHVVHMARAIAAAAADGTPQLVFYDRGVGTAGTLLERLLGGGLGLGLCRNVEDAYRFLAHNYAEGDEIWLFGFSRGAYTVRSTAGLIRNSGLLKKACLDRYPEAFELYRDAARKPDHPECAAFRRAWSWEPRVRFIGVWDTVGALGVPTSWLQRLNWAWLSRHHQRRFAFHDTRLSRSVDNAFHALAIDERRKPFAPAVWQRQPAGNQRVEQVWFAGVHSDVGGGYLAPSLSFVAFEWMADRARACGLALDDGYLKLLPAGDPLGPRHESYRGLYRLLGRLLRPVGRAPSGSESVHRSVGERLRQKPDYRPPNLEA